MKKRLATGMAIGLAAGIAAGMAVGMDAGMAAIQFPKKAPMYNDDCFPDIVDETGMEIPDKTAGEVLHTIFSFVPRFITLVGEQAHRRYGTTCNRKKD